MTNTITIIDKIKWWDNVPDRTKLSMKKAVIGQQNNVTTLTTSEIENVYKYFGFT